MSATSRHLFISNPSVKTSEKKKLRFDEENINQTKSLVKKDYGLMAISRAKTPFPRPNHPVKPEVLRKRLEECIYRANRLLCNEDNDTEEDELTKGTSVWQMSTSSSSSMDESQRHYDFIKKRREFNKAEYIIAQQKSLSSEMPEPGPSVGDNWRIVNYDIKSFIHSIHSVPSNFASSFPSWQSDVNYETLHEIVRQSVS